MIYLKSVTAGILALMLVALFAYAILTLILLIMVRPDGFDLPRWQVHVESPAFWILVIIIFGAGFLWEFHTISN
jgi:hypothetical protein